MQLLSLLRSRPAESEIEIELERTWRHLELTWRWSGPEFDNSVKLGGCLKKCTNTKLGLSIDSSHLCPDSE